MKKILSLLLVFCFVFVLCSCKNANTTTNSSQNEAGEQINKQDDKTNLSEKYAVDDNGTVINFLDTIDTSYKEDKNYSIYTDGFSFRYIVKDNDGNLLDMGYHDYRRNFDLYYLGKMLVLDYGSGGEAIPSRRYYDVEKGRVSAFFLNTIAVTDTKVAYFSYEEKKKKDVLIVQDIFDLSKYYIEFERNFDNGTALFYNTKASFIDNGTKLEITYPYESQKSSPQYKTEILSLS